MTTQAKADIIAQLEDDEASYDEHSAADALPRATDLAYAAGGLRALIHAEPYWARDDLMQLVDHIIAEMGEDAT